jgi:hypothetical protein
VVALDVKGSGLAFVGIERTAGDTVNFFVVDGQRAVTNNRSYWKRCPPLCHPGGPGVPLGPATNGEWESFDVTLVGRTVTVAGREMLFISLGGPKRVCENALAASLRTEVDTTPPRLLDGA